MTGLGFEWDPKKDAANKRKHRIGFAEASTVFGDLLSITIPDFEHGTAEERFVIIGLSAAQRLLVGKDAVMKKPHSKQSGEMKAEYDFSGGVRGKYADHYRKGTNVVLIDPELQKAFPDSRSVNDALRALVAIATRKGPRKQAH